MRRISKKGFLNAPLQQDIGLLLLRLGMGLPMLGYHGIPYLSDFDQEAARFLPLFGLDSRSCLVMVIAAEVAAAFLMVVGLFTRLASLALATTMATAFFIVHGASFGGEQSGELAYLYLVAALAIGIMGPGRFAWDQHRSS